MKKQSGAHAHANRSANTTDGHDMSEVAQQVLDYIETHTKKIDKTTLIKYIGLALVVIYGIRKSNILSSLAISIITGLVTKLLAERFEEENGESPFASLVASEK